MRKKIVAGNWKMNKSFAEGLALFLEIEKELMDNPPGEIKVIISPAYIFINKFTDLKNHTSLAAQNCSNKSDGAFTGEVSASMVKSAGAEYVILGHSERRRYFFETNRMLSEKVEIALRNNMIPVFCIGESLEERNSGQHWSVIRNQLMESLFQLSEADFSKVIVAYEPVWAIGTGISASSGQAQEMHSYIRNLIIDNYSRKIGENCSIIYGGSCNPSNSTELFACPDVDGGLLGGASLNAKDFVQIIHSFRTSR